MAAGNDAKIGGAYFELEARIGKLESDLKLAHQMVTANTEAIATQFDGLATRSQKSSDSIASSFKAAIRPAKELMSAFAMAGGIGAAIVGVGVSAATAAQAVERFFDNLLKGTERARQAAKTIGDAGVAIESYLNDSRIRSIADDRLRELEQAKQKANAFAEALDKEFAGKFSAEELQKYAQQRKQIFEQLEKDQQAINEKYALERFKKEREAADKSDADARDKREQDRQDAAADEERIRQQNADLENEIADIRRRQDAERLESLKRQTQELLKQQAILQDLQQRQIGSFGLGGMEATLKAIRGDLQSIRGVIR